MTSYKFGFPPGFPPGRGLRAAQAPLAPILPSARGAAGTATAATRQCPAFTAASANHRPAPPGPARRHRPRSGRRKTWPPGGHLRPSWGRTPCPACAPAWSSGPGAADPGAGVALGAQDAPPPPARTRCCPFKTSLLPGRGARRRPCRGGQRHPGYRAGDDDGPSGSSQPLRDARLAAAGGGEALPGREGRASAPRKAPARVSLAAARPHLAVAGAWTPGPGTRVTDASPSGPRFARPRRARPTSCACTGGGAPRSQPISGGRPGTAPGVLAGGGAGGRTSWGARRGAAGGRPGSAVWWRSRTPSLPAPTRQLRGSEREGAAGRGAGGA